MAADEPAEYLEEPTSSMDSAESVTLDLSDPRGSIDKILMADALALKSMCEQMGVTYKTKQASAAELLKLVLGLSAETQAPNDEEAGRTASPTAVQSTTPTTTTSTQDSTLNQATPPKSTVQRYNYWLVHSDLVLEPNSLNRSNICET